MSLNLVTYTSPYTGESFSSAQHLNAHAGAVKRRHADIISRLMKDPRVRSIVDEPARTAKSIGELQTLLVRAYNQVLAIARSLNTSGSQIGYSNLIWIELPRHLGRADGAARRAPYGKSQASELIYSDDLLGRFDGPVAEYSQFLAIFDWMEITDPAGREDFNTSDTIHRAASIKLQSLPAVDAIFQQAMDLEMAEIAQDEANRVTLERLQSLDPKLLALTEQDARLAAEAVDLESRLSELQKRRYGIREQQETRKRDMAAALEASSPNTYRNEKLVLCDLIGASGSRLRLCSTARSSGAKKKAA